MTAPRLSPGAPAPGEDAQSSETTGEPLEWQRELDVAIADIDSRLQQPRRRVTDGSAISAAISKTMAPAPSRTPVAPPEPKGLPHGIAVSLRIRRPLFRWPFRRRQRRQRMIMFSDYRIT